MLLSDSPEPPFYTFRLDCHHCHTCQYRDFDLEQDWRSCDEFDPVRGKTKSAMRGMFFGKDCICFSRSIYSVRLIYWGVSWLQATRRGEGGGRGTQNDHIKKTVVWRQDTTCSQWVSECALFPYILYDHLNYDSPIIILGISIWFNRSELWFQNTIYTD